MAKRKTDKRPQGLKPAVNPFTGEPIEGINDWGDVYALVREGNTRKLRSLFKKGMTFEEFRIGYEGRSITRDYLHIAAEAGNLPLVKLLVEQGASTEELHSEYQHTPLEAAVIAKQKQVVNFLLEVTSSQAARKVAWEYLSDSRRKLREIDKQLWDASRKGDLDRARQLLNEGANPNTVQMTPGRGITDSCLSLACQEGFTELVKLLLDSGAAPNLIAMRCLNQTALFSAGIQRETEKATEILPHLIRAGIDVNHQDYENCTWLMRVCEVETSVFCENHHGREAGLADLRQRLALVKFLLNHGADPTLRDKEGATAIHHAGFHLGAGTKIGGEVADTAAEIVALLVNARADFEAMNDYGRTQLMTMSGHLEYERYKSELVQRGVYDPRRDEMLACVWKDDRNQVNELLNAGVNPNGRGDVHFLARQVPPLQLACAYGREEIVDDLLRAGANPDLWGTSLRFDADPALGPPETQEVQDRPDTSRRDWYLPFRKSSLITAINRNHADIVRRLLEAGASLDFERPLAYAEYLGHVECVRLLLDAGADPETAGKELDLNNAQYFRRKDEEMTPDDHIIRKLIDEARHSRPNG